jgi:hypothetical protein
MSTVAVSFALAQKVTFITGEWAPYVPEKLAGSDKFIYYSDKENDLSWTISSTVAAGGLSTLLSY